MRTPETPTQAKVEWQAGWLAGVRQLRSPNFGPRPPDAVVDLIVVHSISLPPGCFEGDAVDALFTNTLDWDAHPYFGQIRGVAVSAHFLVRRNGDVTQYVDCDERAWHAGASSWKGRPNCNDFSVGIELEGLEGGHFEGVQYQHLAQLCRALAMRYPITQVVGHEHIAPGRKCDPGPGFDWSTLRGLTAWPEKMFALESNKPLA